MSYTDKLKVKNASNPSNDLIVDLNDERIDTGSTIPSSGLAGDIYIFNQGDVQQSNGWYYIYRTPHIVECGKTFTVTSQAITTSWSGCYYGSCFGTSGVFAGDFTLLNYPVTFTSTPVVNYGFEDNCDYDFGLYVGELGSGSTGTLLTQAPFFSLCRGTSGTVSCKVYIRAIGEVA